MKEIVEDSIGFWRFIVIFREVKIIEYLKTAWLFPYDKKFATFSCKKFAIFILFNYRKIWKPQDFMKEINSWRRRPTVYNFSIWTQSFDTATQMDSDGIPVDLDFTKVNCIFLFVFMLYLMILLVMTFWRSISIKIQCSNLFILLDVLKYISHNSKVVLKLNLFKSRLRLGFCCCLFGPYGYVKIWAITKSQQN